MAHTQQSLCHTLADTFSVMAQRLLLQGIIDTPSIQLPEGRATLLAAVTLVAMAAGAILDRLIATAGCACWRHVPSIARKTSTINTYLAIPV